MTKIYRYVVRHDGGSAPRPYGGICSLAICKPKIRQTASVGDWIIGFRSGRHDQVVYVMQVGEVLTFKEYWERYPDRRSNESPVPDNIYRPNGSDEFEQVVNRIHAHDQSVRDLSGRNVLLANRFWYFGAQSPELPDKVKHLLPYGRGHSVHINRLPSDEKLLESWLESYRIGIHGTPIDADQELLRWLVKAQAGDTEIPSGGNDASACSRTAKKGCNSPISPKSKCAR